MVAAGNQLNLEFSVIGTSLGPSPVSGLADTAANRPGRRPYTDTSVQDHRGRRTRPVDLRVRRWVGVHPVSTPRLQAWAPPGGVTTSAPTTTSTPTTTTTAPTQDDHHHDDHADDHHHHDDHGTSAVIVRSWRGQHRQRVVLGPERGQVCRDQRQRQQRRHAGRAVPHARRSAGQSQARYHHRAAGGQLQRVGHRRRGRHHHPELPG